MTKSRAKSSRRHRHGLSLIELVLALGATSFIGLAISAMLHAVAYGSQSNDGLQTLVTRHQVLAARLGTGFRQTRQVLSASSNELVLWQTNDDGNNNIDSLELVWWRYDPASQTLVAEYGDRSVLGNSGTPVIPGVTSYSFVRWGFSAFGNLETQTLARGVTGFSYALNESDPLLATLMTVTITFEENGHSDTMVHTLKLRN